MKKSVLFLGAVLAFALVGCGQKGASSGDETKQDEAAFAANQPMESGTYQADYYDITGPNARKGHFDGRVLVSLSPEVSALYVYENGNHAKIDYLVMLSKPFEKGDSGIYRALDKEGKTVTVKTDSVYSLSFDKKDSQVTINFEKNPLSTQPAMNVIEKINELKTKK